MMYGDSRTDPGESEEALWKALADPSRRRILDLLRRRARTTGELTGHFDFSRFAVMKHLKILEGAGLVVVERRGRERYNHLDPLPIRSLQRRWIRPFAARAADRVLRLKERAERDASQEGTMEQESPEIVEVRIETTIEAPPATVWQALTRDISRWWPEEFYTGGRPGKRQYLLEATPGGRMMEDWGDGEGLLWATVHSVEKERCLRVSGHSFPAWGGPGILLATWELEPAGGGTLLRFAESALGRCSEEYVESKEKGWSFLFDGCLKAFVEGTEAPTWVD